MCYEFDRYWREQRAEEALKDRKTDIDYAQAQADLAQAIAQLQFIRKLRDKTKR